MDEGGRAGGRANRRMGRGSGVQLNTRNVVEDAHCLPNHRSHTIHPTTPPHPRVDGRTDVRTVKRRDGEPEGVSDGRTDGRTDDWLLAE